ncbi:hypothetical protein GF380_02075 [Candidatus Uhrbacteria bacterium]|nr:hypothetical protein [Candidatus Uhrbacteria bacterium]
MNKRAVADLEVMRYLLEEEDPVRQAYIEFTGRGWAIRRAEGICLHKVAADGVYHFIIEPLPSNRNDEYFKETRFESASEALAFWDNNRDRIVFNFEDRNRLRGGVE